MGTNARHVEQRVTPRRETADSQAKAAFLKAVAAANGVSAPPSVLCPLRHYETHRPLLRDFYSLDGAGVLHVRASAPRHSSLDHLLLRVPSVRLRSVGLGRLEDYGFDLKGNFIRGSLSARYGPLHFLIRSRLHGNLRDSKRVAMEHEWTLNPSWFVGFSDIIRLGALIFDGFDPDRAQVGAMDCATDMGIPGPLFKSMIATDTKVKGTSYDNGHQATRGMFNGFQTGAGNDRWRTYDKQHQMMYRRSEVREILADVPWWRMERRLSGDRLPIKTLSDLSDLVDFNPFQGQVFRLAQAHTKKVTPSTPHWRSLLAKLVRFETIMERETQVRAIRALNGQGHFQQLVKRGYITMTPIPLDPAADWRAGMEAFFSPGGGLVEASNYDFETDKECGYS